MKPGFLRIGIATLWGGAALLCLIFLGALLICGNYVDCAIILALTLFTILLPRSALGILLFALPVFGNRPGTPQTYWFLLVSLALTLGLIIRFGLVNHADWKQKFNPTPGVLVLGFWYVVVSLLSLFNLPWREFSELLESQLPSFSSIVPLCFRLLSLLHSTEEKFEYSLLSALWTILTFVLGCALYLSAARDRRMVLIYWSCLCAGLCMSLVVGILDYYEIINLRMLRTLDPIVNPGDVQFRLQSFFGHSGWFAEYVTLLIPSSLVLLLLPLTFRSRVALILALMLLGEFVLILTFQRGGWLSYPLTLFVIWACIYVTHRIEQRTTDFAQALKSSLTKIFISLPLTILCSLLLLWGMNQLTRQGEGSFQLSRYVERFNEIKKTSDRSEFFRAGFKLGMLNPILGLGSESFAYQYRREFRQPLGHYIGEIDLPLHGSAHNVYMQTFSGKGILGLGLLLFLMGYTIIRSVRLTLNNAWLAHWQKISLLASSSFGMAFLVYGNVQEIFYVAPLQMVFFGVLGLTSAVAPEEFTLRIRTQKTIGIIVGCLFLVQILCNILQTSRTDLEKEFGCFAKETESVGVNYRWCGPHIRQAFKVESADGRSFVTLHLRIAPRGKSTSPATIKIFDQDRLAFEQLAVPGTEIKTKIPVTFAGLSPTVLLEIHTAYYFIPAYESARSEDRRVLSYRLYE